MSLANEIYEKTQKAKISLKNLLKTSKGNIKSLIQKNPNESTANLTRNIISLSQLYSNLKHHGPAINFNLEADTSCESSPSLLNFDFRQKKIRPLLKKEVVELLFETFQTEFSDDFQRFTQFFAGFDKEKIGLIITNIQIKADIEALKNIIMSSTYKPELSVLKMMYFKSKPAIIIKIKKISDFFMLLNFFSTNKATKLLLGPDMKVLWFRKLEQNQSPYNEYSKIILRNLPSNFNTLMIKKFIEDKNNDIEIKYIEDPMYYKEQLSTIVILENIFQAENLVKTLNKLILQEKYLIKVNVLCFYKKFTLRIGSFASTINSRFIQISF